MRFKKNRKATTGTIEVLHQNKVKLYLQNLKSSLFNLGKDRVITNVCKNTRRKNQTKWLLVQVEALAQERKDLRKY